MVLGELISVDAKLYVKKGEPLDALPIFYGTVPNQPLGSRPFCAFTDSAPLSPMSVIVYNREGRQRNLLVTERRFSHQQNCCMGGKHNFSGKPTCHGTPDDILCRAVCARDWLNVEPEYDLVEPQVDTPVPYMCPVLCSGCAIVVVLSGYASDDPQTRAYSTLLVTYDLRNISDRGATWSPLVQPLAMYEYRLRWLLDRAPVTFNGKTYK